ncbi:MAG: cation transporter [Candidatus Solibacter usitatus]|nr:cation transporter [Candidatus Solibacter usitatus]
MSGGNASIGKESAAANSVVAAVGLTSLKVIVGLMTGSLGILAEAAHSALDLAAAMMTWFAVRLSGKPADREHLYGHGKVENLSAMFETTLLIGTCAWIVHSAVTRLRTGNVEIEVNVWSFAVMAISIIVDVSRSRMLYKAAAEHKSQALEADALHFSTDIWSSAVVLVGLGAVKLSQWYPAAQWLKSADAVAAIIVAVIVFIVSLRLGLRTVHALLDGVPPGLDQQIAEAAESVPGVGNCHNIRARFSGPQLFVDAHVLVDGAQSLSDAHKLTDEVEAAIQKILPGCDVTVHAEPLEHHGEARQSRAAGG